VATRLSVWDWRQPIEATTANRPRRNACLMDIFMKRPLGRAVSLSAFSTSFRCNCTAEITNIKRDLVHESVQIVKRLRRRKEHRNLYLHDRFEPIECLQGGALLFWPVHALPIPRSRTFGSRSERIGPLHGEARLPDLWRICWGDTCKLRSHVINDVKIAVWPIVIPQP